MEGTGVAPIEPASGAAEMSPPTREERAWERYMDGKLDLVRSWQHHDQVHLRGCPSTQYLTETCTSACSRVTRGLRLAPELVERLPISGSEVHESELQAY